MKLKYKKIILLTTLSTMGIGLLTLSLSHDKTLAKESLSTRAATEAEVLEDNNIQEFSTLSKGLIEETQISSTAATLLKTPAPKPVYEIEDEGYPEINQLFVDFYSSKIKCDVNAIKLLLSDPNQVGSLENLQKKTLFIEEYKNIKAYHKKSFEEGTYIVYVYHEIKFTGIDTPAPGLSKFFVVTDEDGQLKILSEAMDEETQSYYDQRNEDEDVVKIIEMTNEKSKKAMKKDENLQNFWKSIDEMTKNSKNVQAEGDSNE